jgi:hypothetical protein
MPSVINGNTPCALRHARPLIESLPFPSALWSWDHRPYVFNQPARDLLGFSESDYLRRSLLWIDQIHPEDRDRFDSAWRDVKRGAPSASCRYRFLPGEVSEPIAVCELLYSYAWADQTAPAVWSVYHQEPCGDGAAIERRQVRALFEGLAHEIGNSLQAIRGEIDLLSLTGFLPSGSAATVRRSVEQICQRANEMRDFLAPPSLGERREDAAAVIQELIAGAAPRLEKLGIRLSAGGRGSLPEVVVGLAFREALRRVIEFSGALLSQGGELTIEAGVKRSAVSSELEVRVVNQSRTCLDVEERDVFRPYVKVNRHRLGLTLSIARQTLRRHFGDIIFEKQQDNRGVFSIFLKLPAERPSP